MAQHYDLTSVGANPADDRSRRMTVYFVAMTVRIACVASLFFVRGWWIILVGLAAVILPYFAVIFANERATPTGSRPDQPTPAEITAGRVVEDDKNTSSAEAVLIVDAPADRRAAAGGDVEASDERDVTDQAAPTETRPEGQETTA